MGRRGVVGVLFLVALGAGILGVWWSRAGRLEPADEAVAASLGGVDAGTPRPRGVTPEDVARAARVLASRSDSGVALGAEGAREALTETGLAPQLVDQAIEIAAAQQLTDTFRGCLRRENRPGMHVIVVDGAADTIRSVSLRGDGAPPEVQSCLDSVIGTYLPRQATRRTFTVMQQ